MEIVAFILAIVALAAFLGAAFDVNARRYNFIAVGLFLVTLAWVVQLVTSGRQVHS